MMWLWSASRTAAPSLWRSSMVLHKLCPCLSTVQRLPARLRHGANRNVLRLGRERGLVQDVCPPKKEEEIAKHLAHPNPRCVYAGFDPTADSLHVGNLLVLQALLHFRRAGHRVIALIGGGTAKIGDPSGKSTERPLLEDEAILKNARGIAENILRVFENHARLYGDWFPHLADDGEGGVKVLNNLEWYGDVGVLEYLAKYGRHFRIVRMLRTKSVKDRLETEEGLNFAEFAYQTFQAADWLRLLEEHNCTLQVGGSDQLGNMRAGKDLVHKVHMDAGIYGFTVPLITTSKGEKIGKTAGGNAIWLSPSQTSPFDFYQYFVRVPDSDVERMLKLFTFLPLAEVDNLMVKHLKRPEKLLAQRKLAEQVTLLVHGQGGLEEAQRITSVLYDSNPGMLGQLSLAELRSTFINAAYVRLLFETGLTVLDLAMKVGCFKSEKDAIRVISAGGFYVNQIRVRNTEEVVMPDVHLLPNNSMLIRVGKRNYFIVEWLL